MRHPWTRPLGTLATATLEEGQRPTWVGDLESEKAGGKRVIGDSAGSRRALTLTC